MSVVQRLALCADGFRPSRAFLMQSCVGWFFPAIGDIALASKRRCDFAHKLLTQPVSSTIREFLEGLGQASACSNTIKFEKHSIHEFVIQQAEVFDRHNRRSPSGWALMGSLCGIALPSMVGSPAARTTS